MRRWKWGFFERFVPPDARVLEVGCGGGWVRERVSAAGCDYTGLDLVPPADVVGDIVGWEALGLRAASFDRIVAFEVIEHVDCAQACHDLLVPGGLLLVTTPVPRADGFLALFERAGFLQKRTSPHAHLVDVRTLRGFEVVAFTRPFLVVQWGVLRRL